MEQTHVMNLMFMLDDSTAPVTNAGSYIDEYTDLDEGAASVCNDQNCVLSAASVLTDARVPAHGVRIVGRLNNELVYSDFIKAEDIISYRGIAYAAAAEQITFIGYTGAASSIRVINDNVYKMKINFTEIGRTGQGRQNHIDVMYHSADAATATEVTFGLMTNLRGSLDAEPVNVITAGVRNSAAVTAGNALDHDTTVVQGSKYVTIATNSQYATGSELAVGDLLRIGTVAGGTALTNNVYYVEELVSITVVKLDRPVTDASGTYATGTDDIEVIPAASIANYGISLTGVAQSWTLGKRPWSKIVFTVGLEDFGATEISYNTAASLGSGTENQLRDLEYFCKGQKGNTYRGDPRSYIPYTSAVSAADTFEQIAITWASNSRSEGINGPGHNPKQLIIACEQSYDNTDANDIVIEVLDAYAGSVGFAACGFAK